jgi:hypothetical protein
MVENPTTFYFKFFKRDFTQKWLKTKMKWLRMETLQNPDSGSASNKTDIINQRL